ncbi:hypothetical protein PW5551_08700, partial [Petrotoga sp. 9PW.55.5.1]|uniref:methyl-accepting chemotaxis protein n=1 Tax=Petrotoga sp. 9PW.55.5.1 TaxID=1308979 RepID=UPI000DC584F2
MSEENNFKIPWFKRFGNKIGLLLIVFALIPSIFLVSYITISIQNRSEENEQKITELIDNLTQDYLNQIIEFNFLVQEQLNQYNEYLDGQIKYLESELTTQIEENYTNSFDESLKTLSDIFLNFIESQENELEKTGKMIASIPSIKEKTASKSISLVERYSLLEPYVTAQQYNGMQLWIMSPPDTRGSGLDIEVKNVSYKVQNKAETYLKGYEYTKQLKMDDFLKEQFEKILDLGYLTPIIQTKSFDSRPYFVGIFPIADPIATNTVNGFLVVLEEFENQKLLEISRLIDGYISLYDSNFSVTYSNLPQEELSINQNKINDQFVIEEILNKQLRSYYFATEKFDGIYVQISKEFETIETNVDLSLQKTFQLPAFSPKQASFEIEMGLSEVIRNIIIILIILIVAIIIFSYWFGQQYGNRIKSLTEKLKELTSGDLTVDFESKSKDEIGQMANALSGMSKELRKSMGSIKQASSKVESASKTLTNSSQESRKNSEKLKAQIDKIQTSTEETAGNVEEVTSGVDEVARAAQGVSQDAQRLNEEAEETNKAAQEGSKTIEEINETVKEAVGRTKESQKEVEKLASNAKNVQSIVETISSITEQTNLLALNAAIEAA